MKKVKFICFCAATEAMLILNIALANIKPTPVRYFFFYNLAYGLVFSFIVLLYMLYKEKGTFSSVGMKEPGGRQLLVLILFVAFSVGGQLLPIAVAGGQIPWHLLPMGIVPLIMTTFFEEFLFRGFVQSRAEQHFGWLPALFISGLMFSLYHLGYPGFRTLGNILLLFAVGFGFAAAYKLSGNNLFVSYFVNLPNAFVTYILKYEQFPTMNSGATISGIITLILIVIVLYSTWNVYNRQ